MGTLLVIRLAVLGIALLFAVITLIPRLAVLAVVAIAAWRPPAWCRRVTATT